MFSWSSLQAPAFLTCSSPGKASPGRGYPGSVAPAGPGAREALASREQRDPVGEKRTECRVEGAPTSVRCGQRQAGCGWERRPAWRRVSAVRKCSSLFFPFSVVGLGHAFFIFGRLG